MMGAEQTQTIIVTVVSVIVANWAMVAPMLKFIVKNAWEKSIEWRDMVHDINEMKLKLSKVEKDLTAAHTKIRDVQNGKNHT